MLGNEIFFLVQWDLAFVRDNNMKITSVSQELREMRFAVLHADRHNDEQLLQSACQNIVRFCSVRKFSDSWLKIFTEIYWVLQSLKGKSGSKSRESCRGGGKRTCEKQKRARGLESESWSRIQDGLANKICYVSAPQSSLMRDVIRIGHPRHCLRHTLDTITGSLCDYHYD